MKTDNKKYDHTLLIIKSFRLLRLHLKHKLPCQLNIIHNGKMLIKSRHVKPR